MKRPHSSNNKWTSKTQLQNRDVKLIKQTFFLIDNNKKKNIGKISRKFGFYTRALTKEFINRKIKYSSFVIDYQ